MKKQSRHPFHLSSAAVMVTLDWLQVTARFGFIYDSGVTALVGHSCPQARLLDAVTTSMEKEGNRIIVLLPNYCDSVEESYQNA